MQSQRIPLRFSALLALVLAVAAWLLWDAPTGVPQATTSGSTAQHASR